MKTAITGCPKSGKTYLSKNMGSEVKHTDDLVHLGWSEMSDVASFWFDSPDTEIVEGMAVTRALRKWLARNSDNNDKPVEKVIYLKNPQITLTANQENMAKGNLTIWNEIKGDLINRGVIIEERG